MKNIDVLLINPPSRAEVYQTLSEFSAIEPPVWAGLIARYLNNHGIRTQILDAEAHGYFPEETADRINALAPTLAVFCIYGHQPSASTQCMPGAMATSKRVNASIYTMALGTHPSALPHQTLRDGFDMVCVGEGPRTIMDTFDTIKNKTLLFSKVKGLITTGKVTWEPAPNIEHLDRVLPDQAWELLDMRMYRPHYWHSFTAKGHGYASIQTSLGCPFKCSFCCINAPFGGPGIRYWSPKNITLQINWLVEQYGIRNIKIPDEMFVLNPKHVKQICNNIITLGLGDELNIWAYARVDTVNDTEMLDLMRRAGFRWLGVGVESASKHVRDGIEKGRFGEKEIFDAFHRIRSADLHIGANYIFGLPDDTKETMRETLDLAKALNAAHANFYCAMAYPGSALHKVARERSWPLPENPGGPGWIGYSQHSYDSMPLRTETLTYQEVLDFRDAAFLEYHAREDYLKFLREEFGQKAVDITEKILSRGMPKRRHRG